MLASVSSCKGMPPNSASTIFFPKIYVGDDIIVDGRKSLGLGLSLCKSIINAHGCEIILSSNEPTGTIFTFDLPIKEVTIHE